MAKIVQQALDPDARSVSLGDTVATQTGANEWASAWSRKGVTVTHKANATNAAEAWSAVKYTNLLGTTLLGGDLVNGDLGVSGMSAATSTVRQEIDGKEALRFTLDDAASAVTLSLASFFAGDDGSAYAEGARVRLFDRAGALVGEHFVAATEADGRQAVQLAANQPFVTMELSAGARDAGGNFVFGAYAGANGGAATAIFTNASGAHGSEFLVHQVVFEFARPTAAADSYQATEDGGAQSFGGLLANDVNPNTAPLSAELLFAAEHGTVTLNADGSFTYVPDADYFGADSFVYRAFNGKDYSDPTTVNLDVRSVNDAPVAVDDSATVLQDSGATVIDVLANDRAGPANEAAQKLALSAASAAHGTVTVNAQGQLVYTPKAGFSGLDTISYIVSDDGSSNGALDPRSAGATLTVTVIDINDAPLAAGDSLETDEDSTVSGNVLDGSNGGRDTDPDGDTLVVLSTGSFATALGGSVTLNANGSFQYSAAGSATLQALGAGASAADHFSYTISDGHGNTSTARVDVTVHGRDEVQPPAPGSAKLLSSFTPGTEISYYLRYTAGGKTQWLEVDGFDWGVSAATSDLKGSGAAVGKADPGTFSLTLGSSKAVTDFLAKILTGTHFPDLVLEGLVLDQTGRPAVAQEFLLKDAFVTDLDSGSGGTRVGFVAKEISEQIARVDGTGKFLAPSEFKWNIPAMTGNPTSAIQPGVQAELDRLLPVTPRDAELDYYVRIDGIDGWFQLADFEMGFSAESTYTKGAGAAVGKPVPDALTLQLGTSQAITKLLGHMVAGTHTGSIQIEAYQRNTSSADGKPQLVDEYIFNNVFVTSVASGDDGDNEVGVVFKSYTQSHQAWGADGRLVDTASGGIGFDLATARTIAVPKAVAEAGTNPANALLWDIPQDSDIEYFLRYTSGGKTQWLEIDGFDWTVTAEATELKGTGAAVGKPDPGTFSLTLGSSKAVSDFLAKIFTGTHFPDLVLEGVVRDRDGRPAIAQEFLFTNAFVTEVETGSGGTSIGFVAKEISEQIARVDGTGKFLAPSEFKWNIPAMTGNPTSAIQPGVQADLDHLLATTPRDAELDYYVRIDGIEGWFQLADFDMGFSAESSYTKGAGTAVGKPVPDALTLQLGTSQAITKLLGHMVAGTHTGSIQIEAYQRNTSSADGKPQLVDEYIFNNVFVTSVASGDDGDNEVGVVFKSYTQSHQAWGADGKPISAASGGTGIDLAVDKTIAAPAPVAEAGTNPANRVLWDIAQDSEVHYFLRYTAGGQAQWLEIDGFDWEVTAETSQLKGSGAAVGKPDPGVFSLQLGNSKAGADFLAKLLTGTHFADLVLEGVVLDERGRPAVAQEFLLKDAFVTKVDTGSSGTSIGLVAKEISEQVAQVDSMGKFLKPAEFKWNIAAMNNNTSANIVPGVQADLDHLLQMTPRDAELDYYVRIDGIDGWFDLADFDMGFSAESTYTKGGGAAVGKPVPDKLFLQLGTSQALAKLLGQMVSGVPTRVIEIEAYGRAIGPDGQRVLVDEYFFNDVFGTEVISGDDGYNELAFVYKSFTGYHLAYDERGRVDTDSSGGVGFDLATAKVIGVPAPVADLF